MSGDSDAEKVRPFRGPDGSWMCSIERDSKASQSPVRIRTLPDPRTRGEQQITLRDVIDVAPRYPRMIVTVKLAAVFSLFTVVLRPWALVDLQTDYVSPHFIGAQTVDFFNDPSFNNPSWSS